MKRIPSFSTRDMARAFEAMVVATATASALAVACGGGTAAGGSAETAGDGGGGGGGDGGGALSYVGFTKLQPQDACDKPLSLLAGIHPADEGAAFQSRHASVNAAYLANADDGGVTDPTSCPEGVVSNTLLESFGDVCSRATDKATCLQRVACVTPPGRGWLAFVCSGPCYQSNEGTFYLEVNGDTISFPTDLKTMLGPIDTASEAVLIAKLNGYDAPTGCDAKTPVAYREVDGAIELLVVRQQQCGSGLVQNRIRVDRDGTITVLDTSELVPPSMTVCASGRRPEGFVVAEPGGAARGLVAYLKELAVLEAASIAEFATLRDELSAYGAPDDLVAGAETARRDEIAHARLTQQLVRLFGGRASRVSVEQRPMRTLEELAIHNAVEGCVRETFGALSATWQAQHAGSPAIARAFAVIAEDETRHAAFSWELATWLDGKLDARARARVFEARQQGLEELRAALAVIPDEQVIALAGMPTVAEAQRLLAQMSDLFALDAAA